MKLNWGHYIVIGFTLFVMLILYMVYRSFQHNNDLVTEEYYARELEYQDVIEKRNRADNLDSNVTWAMGEGGLIITYPSGMRDLSGKILLYRPSDKNLDIEVDVQPDSTNHQVIEWKDLNTGKYTVQIDWSYKGRAYFTEGVVFVSK